MSQNLQPILLVEDSANDRELITLALEKCQLVNPIISVADGEEALDYLFRRGAWKDVHGELPIFVLLDKKLPKVDGHEVLAEIRANESTAHLPVLMLTSSRHESDLLKSYDLGVNAYVVKPLQYQEFIEAVQDIGVFWAFRHEQAPLFAGIGEGQRMAVKSPDILTG